MTNGSEKILKMSPIAKMITFKLKRRVCSKFAINQAQNVLVGTQAAAFCCGFYNFAVTFRNEYSEPVVVLLVKFILGACFRCSH